MQVAPGFQAIPNARSVLVFGGNGFGPVSDWEIGAVYVSPSRAMELQGAYVRAGFKVRTCRYEDLDDTLVDLCRKRA